MLAIPLLRSLAAATVAATLASGVEASEYDVPVNEWVTMPKFCWHQFSEGRTAGMDLGEGPSFTNCGPHMNHYCYGLLDLQRSTKAKNVADRKMLLGRARVHTLYTLNGMKADGTLGTCAITSHVEATMRTIDLRMQIYGMKTK